MNFLKIKYAGGQENHFNITDIIEFTVLREGLREGLDVTFMSKGKVYFEKGDYQSWELI